MVGKRMDTICNVVGFENIWNRRPHVIGFVADLCFSTLESGFKSIEICRQIRRKRVDGSRIWKGKAADSKISGYVWTGLTFCSSACMGLSDLYVRFWKLLTYRKCQCWIGHFPSKEQRKMNCFGVFSAQVLLLRLLLELSLFS